jgi:hypothetical protein
MARGVVSDDVHRLVRLFVSQCLQAVPRSLAVVCGNAQSRSFRRCSSSWCPCRNACWAVPVPDQHLLTLGAPVTLRIGSQLSLHGAHGARPVGSGGGQCDAQRMSGRKTPSSSAYYIIILVGVRGELGGFLVIDRAQRIARKGSPTAVNAGLELLKIAGLKFPNSDVRFGLWEQFADVILPVLQ